MKTNYKIDELVLEQELASDAKEIKDIQKRIDAEEHKLEKMESQFFKNMSRRPKLGLFSRPKNSKVSHFHDYLLHKLSKHKFVYSLIVALGAVLVWRGLWDISVKIPFLSSEFAALGFGVVILWVTQKYSDL